MVFHLSLLSSQLSISPADTPDGPFRFVGTIRDLTIDWIDSTPVGEEGAEVPADDGTPPRLKFPVIANGRLWGVGLNASGGLKAKGHPIGATGVSQIVEVFKQLNDMAGKRQLSDVNLGMTQNLGGSGSTIVCHILERGN